MAKHRQQSVLRYPLTVILGSVANVRTLRELVRHGGELSAPSLVKRTGLAKASVRQALQILETMKIVETLGAERSRLFRVQRKHPLAAALDELFQEEERRFEAVLSAIRVATDRCVGLTAAWLYGSVARGEDREASDVDVAVVGEPEAIPLIEQTLREALAEAEERLAFRASVVAIDTRDVLRLAAENDRWWTGLADASLGIVGDPPDVLLERLKRQRNTGRNADRRRAS
ncbi:MAG TPA: nucleotidyltransferase domain-containing protein [Dongiaceae bacterium]|nr:nucleotidyltransferase domain-containing protein [Dongiaceae bacterium]